jgi:DNA modification methylase
MNRCYVGDTRDGMREFIAQGHRVQTVVTSPPYWGLRDYGVDGQLGLEPTPAQFVESMVAVFRLVRELLADNGTLWLNMGDSYSSAPKGSPDNLTSGLTNHGRASFRANCLDRAVDKSAGGLKPKDLCGIPWRLALALQADGWYLRSDIIWHKPNPMPESITDRPTKAHEYVFLLTKSERYFYDADAIKEPANGNAHARRKVVPRGWNTGEGAHAAVSHSANAQPRAPGVNPKAQLAGSGIKNNESFSAAVADLVNDRNKRTVWTIPTESFSGAHFATFPQALVEPCILAGSRVGDVVFDPFFGAGTTGYVAKRLGRRFLGCELNPMYAEMARRRIDGLTPSLFAEAAD